jgi:hypothetical protein
MGRSRVADNAVKGMDQSGFPPIAGPGGAGSRLIAGPGPRSATTDCEAIPRGAGPGDWAEDVMATPTGSAQKKTRKIIRFVFRPTVYPFPEAIHHHPLDQVIRLLEIGNARNLSSSSRDRFAEIAVAVGPLADQGPIASRRFR